MSKSSKPIRELTDSELYDLMKSAVSVGVFQASLLLGLIGAGLAVIAASCGHH